MKCPKCHSDNPDTSRFCGSCATVLTSELSPSPSLTKTIQTSFGPAAAGSSIAGKYRIVEEVGRGGMGVVYKAEDIKLQRPVALKFLPHQWISDTDARERFIQEARAASALDHPNICNIYEIGEVENGQMYIAMAFYEGESLREKIRRGSLPAKEALGIAIQAATGMAKAHQKGIVHRDIKPANMLITTDGVVKVVDFGLAKLAGQIRLTREGTTIGTVAYMSPEQAKGEAVDQRTDIWSLGVVLYEMLSGFLPFKGDYEQTLIHSILQQEPERLTKICKGLPSGLENIVFKALSKKPNDRYRSMDEVLADLRAIADGLSPERGASLFLRGHVLGVKKTVAYPALAGAVVLAVLAALIVFPERGQAHDSLAVLPIENISGDPEQDAFCDGVHQELITRLSSIRAFKKVIAKNTMMVFKGTKLKSSEIANELNVSVIVSGSAIRSGEKVRIRFEVIDGSNDTQISGENFDGDYRDILNLESEAARTITQRIQASLTPAEASALSQKRTVSPDAYDLYLKAMFIVNFALGTKDSLEKSIGYFGQALEIDPNFALAHAGLAWAYDNYAPLSTPREAWAKAKSAAEKALSLDESVSLAHVVLADMKTYHGWDWKGAEKAYRRALELNPNDATAHYCYALLLGVVGKADEAIFHASRGLELDPRSYMARWCAINAFSFAGRPDKAITTAQETLRLYPDDPSITWLLICNYYRQGKTEEVVAGSRKLIELAGNWPDEMRLYWQSACYAFLGDRPKARDMADSLFKLGGQVQIDVTGLAMVFALLGDNDRAFKLLEDEWDRRTPGYIYLKVQIGLTAFSSDPRYKEILRRMGLE